ncbi:MAG: tol-pal system YbgF family protein [Myxococcota bacterium]
METEDPRAAIAAKDLPTQAAGARDLARIGTWDDVDDLLDLAMNHKRTGLKLIAASAAADIVHRYRTGTAGEPLGDERAEDLASWVKRTDPGINPGILMLLSAVPTPKVIDRLGRLLRDPRGDVRTGAAVAVRRMAVSHTDLDMAPLRAAVLKWLTDRRSPPDALTALVQLVGGLGWSELRDTLIDLSTTSEPVREAVTEALGQLDQRAAAENWHGLWLSNGLDVLEQVAEDPALSWLVIGHSKLAIQGRKPSAHKLSHGALTSRALPSAARLAWVPRLGHSNRTPAVQVLGHTWYRVEGTELAAWLDEHALELSEAAAPALDGLAGTLADEEGAAGARARAIAHVLADQLDQADEQLSKLTSGKKPRADLLFWLGELRRRQGRPKDARDAYSAFIDRNPKKSVFLEPAQNHLVQLGGA